MKELQPHLQALNLAHNSRLGHAVLALLPLLGLGTGCASDGLGLAADPGSDPADAPAASNPRIAIARPADPARAAADIAGEIERRAPGAPTAPPGRIGLLPYNGGPVMTTVNLYYIWYGNWTGNTANAILTDLAQNIGDSPYYNINTTYTDSTGAHVANAVRYAGSTTDNYSRGKSLDGTGDIQTIVTSAIDSKALPQDPNGLYVVLTASDVSQATFCTSACAWHTWNTIHGDRLKFAWVGNPETQCASRDPGGHVTDNSCIATENLSASPNGNPGADAMASTLTHELEETASDPTLDAWTTSDGGENADTCAWTWGQTYTMSNGSIANMRLGNRDYLIQRNLVNDAGGYCAQAYFSTFEGNTDRPGMDLRDFDLPAARPELCHRECEADTACKSYVFGFPGLVGANAHCWLKNGVPGTGTNANTISGVKEAYEPGVNRAGLDYRNFDLSDARADLCAAECAHDGACQSFAYVAPGVQGPSAHCWLKSGVPVVSQTTSVVTSGVRGRIEWFTNRGGGDLSGFFLAAPSPGLCQGYCLLDSRCKAYSYVAPGIQGTSAACWLKSSVPAASADNVVASGVRRGLEPGINRAGGDYRSIALSTADPAACQLACDQDALCRAFTYVIPGVQGPNAMCWLKNTVPAGLSNSLTVSGIQGMAFF